jgi:hypothetical protein
VQGFPSLLDLNVTGTPVAEEVAAGLKKELLVACPDLKFNRFNKEDVAEEDFTEAEEERKERRRKEEEDRLAAEAAAKEAAEEGKNAEEE